jgi:quercetin dioxygenase-like cupin family protein
VSILIQGHFRVRFAGGHEVVLARPGDYVLWPAGVAHACEAPEASVVLTVRWPSRLGDALELDPAQPATPGASKA